VSLDFLEILGRRKKNKISQGGVWADLTPPFVTITNKDSLGPAYDKGQDPGQNCVADVETINQNTVWSSVSKAADMSNKPSRVTLPLSAALRMSRQS